jgi:hypothetical protein
MTQNVSFLFFLVTSSIQHLANAEDCSQKFLAECEDVSGTSISIGDVNSMTL